MRKFKILPAEKAGIRAGGVIYEINRTPVYNTRDCNEVVEGVTGDVLVGTY